MAEGSASAIATDDGGHHGYSDGRTTGHVSPRFRLPDWLNHFNPNDLKIVFRCWLAVWVSLLLIFLKPTLRNLGVATFFSTIVLLMVPPAGILLLYLMVTVTLLLGMCLAWAWGLLAMKAALAVRPASDTAVKLRALMQLAATRAQQSGTSSSNEVSILIHDGFLLDARVTVVFFVMCLAFIYALARLRWASPKLLLLQIFGTIVIDIFLLIGPTLPSFNATLAEVLVKPGAIGIGLGAACSLLIFPQSASFVVLRQMQELVRLGGQTLNASQKRFAGEPLDLTRLHGTRNHIVGIFKTMEPSLGFLPVDISRCCWSADDVKSLQNHVRQALLSCVFLLDFQIAGISAGLSERPHVKSPQDMDQNANLSNNQMEKIDNSEKLRRTATTESRGVIDAFKTSEQYVMSKETMSILKDNTSGLLQTCSLAANLAAGCINTINASRWKLRGNLEALDKLSEDLQEILNELQTCREACGTRTTEAILESHLHLFDANGRLRVLDDLAPNALAGIVLSVAVEEHILCTAKAFERLLDYLLHLIKTRRKSRLWFPTRLQQAVAWLQRGEVSIPSSGVGNGGLLDPDVMEEAYRRLRQSQGSATLPARRRGIGHSIRSVYAWLIDPAGLYALRQVIVTLATSIPAVLPHSAGFFYREKGIWAVVTAQTCLLFYMADFSYSLVSRLFGTIFGGLLALVAWYIGSGHGDGNPYGMAASSGVLAFIVVWLRVFLPASAAQATIMGGSTFALIVGFSWDQHHAQQYGLPGQGFEAFWRRLVTVLLGFAAATIVQLFPRTPSANSHVRKSLSNALQMLSDHYALILSHWGRTEEHSPLEQAAQKLSLEVAETLFSLQSSIDVMKFEMSGSHFEQNSLRRAHSLSRDLNQAIGRLLYASATLPRDLQDRMTSTLGLMDEGAIGNIMAVMTIIEQSLRTCSPLPQIMPTPLVQNCFEVWHAKRNVNLELSMELVRDENYRRYCIAVSAYLRFLIVLDEMVVLLKETLGESHIVHTRDQA